MADPREMKVNCTQWACASGSLVMIQSFWILAQGPDLNQKPEWIHLRAGIPRLVVSGLSTQKWAEWCIQSPGPDGSSKEECRSCKWPQSLPRAMRP